MFINAVNVYRLTQQKMQGLSSMHENSLKLFFMILHFYAELRFVNQGMFAESRKKLYIKNSAKN